MRKAAQQRSRRAAIASSNHRTRTSTRTTTRPVTPVVVAPVVAKKTKEERKIVRDMAHGLAMTILENRKKKNNNNNNNNNERTKYGDIAKTVASDTCKSLGITEHTIHNAIRRIMKKEETTTTQTPTQTDTAPTNTPATTTPTTTNTPATTTPTTTNTPATTAPTTTTTTPTTITTTTPTTTTTTTPTTITTTTTTPTTTTANQHTNLPTEAPVGRDRGGRPKGTTIAAKVELQRNIEKTIVFAAEELKTKQKENKTKERLPKGTLEKIIKLSKKRFDVPPDINISMETV